MLSFLYLITVKLLYASDVNSLFLSSGKQHIWSMPIDIQLSLFFRQTRGSPRREARHQVRLKQSWSLGPLIRALLCRQRGWSRSLVQQRRSRTRKSLTDAKTTHRLTSRLQEECLQVRRGSHDVPPRQSSMHHHLRRWKHRRKLKESRQEPWSIG